MKRSPALFVGLATALVVADQWTKRLATEHLAFQPPVRVVGDLVQLTYARNPGIAFGLFIQLLGCQDFDILNRSLA